MWHYVAEQGHVGRMNGINRHDDVLSRRCGTQDVKSSFNCKIFIHALTKYLWTKILLAVCKRIAPPCREIWSKRPLKVSLFAFSITFYMGPITYILNISVKMFVYSIKGRHYSVWLSPPTPCLYPYFRGYMRGRGSKIRTGSGLLFAPTQVLRLGVSGACKAPQDLVVILIAAHLLLRTC